MKKMKMRGGHQGKIVHKDMTSLLDGHGNHDQLMDKAHIAANKMHGTGSSPMGGYMMGGDESGGEGMGGNVEHYD